MAETFAEKFERALEEKRREIPGYGLRTLARLLAKDDPKNTEIIRRRLNKYRPKPGSGGAAEVAPTEPSRHEIEAAMGLERDALRPEADRVAASAAVIVSVPLDYDLLAEAISRRESARAAQEVTA